MDPEQLLKCYDIHKEGKIRVVHHPFDEICNIDITLKDFFAMFKVVYERDMNSVREDY